MGRNQKEDGVNYTMRNFTKHLSVRRNRIRFYGVGNVTRTREMRNPYKNVIRKEITTLRRRYM
jgi:hypothetical protein